jgi:membrane-bound serine protease (ClpP class)
MDTTADISKEWPGNGVFFRQWRWLLFFGFIFQCLMTPAANAAGDFVAVVRIEGAIGPAQASYFEQSVHKAVANNAAAVTLSLDTPGGLDSAMRVIIRAILGSPIPILTYVNPSGARAASAGTYILYASHVAAMAPGTNLGAATPVALGGPLPGGQDKKPPANDAKEEKEGAATPAVPAMETKAVNDAVAYIRALADLRGRNADWAEKAVREAASLPAREALEENVIDIIAPTLEQLLTAADGRTVTINGSKAQLKTAGLRLEHMEPDWRTKFLAVITDPNMALILMMVGIYGLIFEFMNPGAVYPGTIGAISLIVALYALGTLPINYAGLGLILLGIALMVAEAFAASFGILGIGGAIAFVLGATIMFDGDTPGLEVSWSILLSIAGACLLFTFAVAPVVVRAYRRRVVSGPEQMIGSEGEVLDWANGNGHVFTHGERWQAVSDVPLSAQQKVYITGIDGLTLKVRPASSGDSHD